MEATEIRIKVRKEAGQIGQIVSATALAPSGRILGVVELQIPLLPGFPLSERVGSDAEEQIIATAEDLARRIAVAVLTEPVTAGQGNYWLKNDNDSH